MDDQLRAIQSAVLDRMRIQHRSNVNPQFCGCTFRPSCLVVTFKRKKTAKWLKTMVPTIKPWEGAALEAVSEAELPRCHAIVGYLPESENVSSAHILKLLAAQNKRLNTTFWKVLQKDVQRDTTVVTLAVDEFSATVLKKNKRIASYCFALVLLRPRGETAETCTDGKGSSASIRLVASGSSTKVATAKHKADRKPSAVSLPKAPVGNLTEPQGSSRFLKEYPGFLPPRQVSDHRHRGKRKATWLRSKLHYAATRVS